MNQIYQWSFQHPFLAALVAFLALMMTYDFAFAIFHIIDNMLMRFQWWMIAGRLRDKDGNITRENIESFLKLTNKINKHETEDTSNREEHR